MVEDWGPESQVHCPFLLHFLLHIFHISRSIPKSYGLLIYVLAFASALPQGHV
jgi:hypothetical protein